MDDIKQRLQETSEACVKTFAAWESEKKNQATREELMEAVHELRKVAARLEIELAVSDRRHNNSDPIPIPSHRAGGRESQRPAQDSGNGEGNRGVRRAGVRSKKPVTTEKTDAPAVSEGGKSGKQLSLKSSDTENDA